MISFICIYTIYNNIKDIIEIYNDYEETVNEAKRICEIEGVRYNC